MIRILDPPQQKYLLPDKRLRRETFLLNIDRLKRIGKAGYEIVQYIEYVYNALSTMITLYPLRLSYLSCSLKILHCLGIPCSLHPCSLHLSTGLLHHPTLHGAITAHVLYAKTMACKL